MTPRRRGTILFAHGSRDPRWSRPVEAVAARMRANAPQAPVACAYLEHARPDLGEAVASMAGQGAEVLVIVPMFLGVGQHVRADLPELVRGLQQKHPGLLIELRPAIGEDPRVVDALARVAAD